MVIELLDTYSMMTTMIMMMMIIIPYRAAFHLAPWTLAIALIVSIAVVLFWNLIWRQLTKPNNRVVDHFILGDSTVVSSYLNWEKYKVQ